LIPAASSFYRGATLEITQFRLKNAFFFLIVNIMGYVYTYKDALASQKWAKDPRKTAAVRMEAGLMGEMLRPLPGESVLDIGCGTGMSILTLLEKGLDVTGVDPSPYMLEVAFQNVRHRADLYRGFAENLPFDDNSFNYAVFFTTLEFVDDPRAALEEACRVAKDKIFIGVMNRYAIKGVERRLRGMFTESIYNKARFYSIWEVKAILRSLMGDVPIRWKTVYRLPFIDSRLSRRIESAELLKNFPFGSFAGVSALLVPRFRTKPLALKYAPPKKAGIAAGLSTEYLNADNFNTMGHEVRHGSMFI